jgi:hypothetical protein
MEEGLEEKTLRLTGLWCSMLTHTNKTYERRFRNKNT